MAGEGKDGGGRDVYGFREGEGGNIEGTGGEVMDEEEGDVDGEVVKRDEEGRAGMNADRASRTCCGDGGGLLANRILTHAVCPSMTGTRLHEAETRSGVEARISNSSSLPNSSVGEEASRIPPSILSISHSTFSSSPSMYGTTLSITSIAESPG